MPPLPSLHALTFRLSGLALVAVGAACSATSTAHVPTGLPVARGIVASVAHTATATGIVVRAEPCDFQATADAETHYFRRVSSGRVWPIGAGVADASGTAFGAGAVQPGALVEIYGDGTVSESCPQQGRATAVVVTSS